MHWQRGVCVIELGKKGIYKNILGTKAVKKIELNLKHIRHTSDTHHSQTVHKDVHTDADRGDRDETQLPATKLTCEPWQRQTAVGNEIKQKERRVHTQTHKHTYIHTQIPTRNTQSLTYDI